MSSSESGTPESDEPKKKDKVPPKKESIDKTKKQKDAKEETVSSDVNSKKQSSNKNAKLSKDQSHSGSRQSFISNSKFLNLYSDNNLFQL